MSKLLQRCHSAARPDDFILLDENVCIENDAIDTSIDSSPRTSETFSSEIHNCGVEINDLLGHVIIKRSSY